MSSSRLGAGASAGAGAPAPAFSKKTRGTAGMPVATRLINGWSTTSTVPSPRGIRGYVASDAVGGRGGRTGGCVLNRSVRARLSATASFDRASAAGSFARGP
jgi:hypothetical protein